jgi:hypothetical protein
MRSVVCALCTFFLKNISYFLHFINDLSFFWFYLRTRRLGMDDEDMNNCKRHQICRLRSRYMFFKKYFVFSLFC